MKTDIKSPNNGLVLLWSNLSFASHLRKQWRRGKYESQIKEDEVNSCRKSPLTIVTYRSSFCRPSALTISSAHLSIEVHSSDIHSSPRTPRAPSPNTLVSFSNSMRIHRLLEYWEQILPICPSVTKNDKSFPKVSLHLRDAG